MTKKGAPICFRVRHNGTVHVLNIGIKIDPKYFDAHSEKFLKTTPDYHHTNSQFEALKSKATGYIHSPEGIANFNFEVFEASVFGRTIAQKVVEKTCFYETLKQYADTTPLTYSVFRLYVRTGERLKELYPTLKIKDVGFDVLNKFSAYLVKQHNNAPNTIRNHIKSVKAVVHYAEKMGMVTNKTMAFMKCATVETQRHHLSYVEQTKLYDLYMTGKITYRPQHETVGAFLLSSYTGLRYSDLKNLEGNGEPIIDAGSITFVPLKTQKLSEKPITIPLSNNAKALIKAGALDRIFTNQRCNVYIKEVLEQHMEITERITFHCARHTFASNCIEMGIPIEVIQQFLGHAKIATTMIYAKVSENVKADYMNKWNKLTDSPIAAGSTA